MHIYTKTGDRGHTGLLGGSRVAKNDLRIEAIGAIDELNASLGVLATVADSKEFKNTIASGSEREVEAPIAAKSAALEGATRAPTIASIQNMLFFIGAKLADVRPKKAAAKNDERGIEKEVKEMEKYIDELENGLPPLKNFILPGGTSFAAYAHLSRAICRRAERRTVALAQSTELEPSIIIYLNRLSDLLFMLARMDMHEKKKAEIKWRS